MKLKPLTWKKIFLFIPHASFFKVLTESEEYEFYVLNLKIFFYWVIEQIIKLAVHTSTNLMDHKIIVQ